MKMILFLTIILSLTNLTLTDLAFGEDNLSFKLEQKFAVSDLQRIKDLTINQQIENTGTGLAKICISPMKEQQAFCFIETTTQLGTSEYLISEADYADYLNHPIANTLDLDFIIIETDEFQNLSKKSAILINYKDDQIILSFPNQRVNPKCASGVIGGAIAGGIPGAIAAQPELALLGAIGGALYGASEKCFDSPAPPPKKKKKSKSVGYEYQPEK